MTAYFKIQFLFIIILISAQVNAQVPSNNEPSSAGILSITPTCNWTAGTTINATSTDMSAWGYSGTTCADASCSGGVTAYPNDVFYKFNSLAHTEAVIEIDAPDQIGTVGLLRVYESPNGYDNFSMHACACSQSASLNIGSMLLTGLLPNTVYFIAVSPKVGTTGFWTDFDICLTEQTVLPISLVSFDASHKSNMVSLTWESENELNFAGYSLERSNDMRSFEEIAFITSKKTTNGVSFYEHEYKEDIQQDLYYRLKMIDYDGSYSYSSVQSLKLDFNIMTFSPNPASDYIFINSIQKEQKIEYQVFNPFGQIVLQGILSNMIDLRDLDAGTYFLRTQGSKCQKIIVL